MEQASSRLPVVHQPRYPATSPSIKALATTARRGAALMAAGAVARLVIKQVAAHLVNRGAGLPVARPMDVKPPEAQSSLVEEVVYLRRRIYRP